MNTVFTSVFFSARGSVLRSLPDLRKTKLKTSYLYPKNQSKVKNIKRKFYIIL